MHETTTWVQYSDYFVVDNMVYGYSLIEYIDKYVEYCNNNQVRKRV